MSAKVKICPNCSARNPELEWRCSKCKEDLVGVLPTADPGPGAEGEYARAPGSGETTDSPECPRVIVLQCASSPGLEFPVADGAIVGRGADVDLTPADRDEYISRRHARFRIVDGAWYVEHLGQHPSKLNGVPLGRERPVRVYQGDELMMADKVFVVRLR
jgi:hypothetical protein